MNVDTLVVIAKSSGTESSLLPLWTGLLGGALGLTATLIAAKTSRAIATDQLSQQAIQHRQQLTASIVSANHVRWIETIRNEVAAFTAAVEGIVTSVDSNEAIEKAYAMVDQANLHAATILLLVDHADPDGKALVTEIEKFSDFIDAMMEEDGAVRYQPVKAYIDEIGRITRLLTDAAWARATALS